jgi:hypothetical protein
MEKLVPLVRQGGSEMRHRITAALLAGIACLVMRSGATVAAKEQRLTPHAAETKAAAVLVTAEDLGSGWTLAPPVDLGGQTYADLGANEPECSPRHARLLPGGSERGVGQAESFLAQGVDVFGQNVAIFPTVKAAKRYIVAARTTAFQECVNATDETFTAKPWGDGVTVTKTERDFDGVKVRDEIVGHACTFQFTGEVELTADEYCYELRRGRAIATLITPGSMPVGEQQRLIALLSRRMSTV